MKKNDNSKKCNIYGEKVYFGKFDGTTMSMIILCALLTIPVTFGFVETYWHPFRTLVYGSKVVSKSSIEFPKIDEKDYNKDHGNQRYKEDVWEKYLCQWKFIVANEYTDSANQCCVDCEDDIPERVGCCYFPVFVSPHFFCTSCEDFRCFVFVDSVFSFHGLKGLVECTRNTINDLPTTK